MTGQNQRFRRSAPRPGVEFGYDLQDFPDLLGRAAQDQRVVVRLHRHLACDAACGLAGEGLLKRLRHIIDLSILKPHDLHSHVSLSPRCLGRWRCRGGVASGAEKQHREEAVHGSCDVDPSEFFRAPAAMIADDVGPTNRSSRPAAQAAPAAERQRRWPDMRAFSFVLIAAAACAAPIRTPQLETGLSASIVEEMERLAGAECPTPPELYVLDGIWWVGSFGTVVAVDGGMVAVRRDNPKDWPADTRFLLVPIATRGSSAGIKGDAVIVGQCEDVLIGRFFPRPYGAPDLPALGDQAWVDHSTTSSMLDSWRASRRGE